MTDHDPLAEALHSVHSWDTATERMEAEAIARALDAAGYEIRPKLTADSQTEALLEALAKLGVYSAGDLQELLDSLDAPKLTVERLQEVLDAHWLAHWLDRIGDRLGCTCGEWMVSCDACGGQAISAVQSACSRSHARCA